MRNALDWHRFQRKMMRWTDSILVTGALFVIVSIIIGTIWLGIQWMMFLERVFA